MLRTVPLCSERQEPNAAEEVAEEAILLHAHETGRRGSTQPAPDTSAHEVAAVSERWKSVRIQCNGCIR